MHDHLKMIIVIKGKDTSYINVILIKLKIEKSVSSYYYCPTSNHD